MVPWMQISKAVADNITVPPSSLLAAVTAGLAIHASFLAFNWAAVNTLRLGTTAESRKGQLSARCIQEGFWLHSS